METSKDHPKENKQRLFIQRLLHSKAVSLHHCLWQKVKAGRGAGELFYSERKGKASGILIEVVGTETLEAGSLETGNVV